MISHHHCVDPRYSTVSIATRIYFLQAAIDVGTSRSLDYSIRKVTVGIRLKSLDALSSKSHMLVCPEGIGGYSIDRQWH